MNCSESVDDYCDVSAAHRFKIPEPNPAGDRNGDQFRIEIEVEKTFPVLEEDDEEMQFDDERVFVRVEDRKTFTFWAPCPRFKEKNLTRERISGMLSAVGVVLHKQDFMVERISARADEIAKGNKAARILPVFVFTTLLLVLVTSSHYFAS